MRLLEQKESFDFVPNVSVVESRSDREDNDCNLRIVFSDCRLSVEKREADVFGKSSFTFIPWSSLNMMAVADVVVELAKESRLMKGATEALLNDLKRSERRADRWYRRARKLQKRIDSLEAALNKDEKEDI